MRTLNALTTAQQAASREPYLRLHLDNRAGITVTYTTRDATNRIHSIEQWEEGYAGVTVIRLKNQDQALSAVDYRGYSVDVGWGIVLNSTPDSTWYSNAADMKVIYQRDISYQGELLLELHCVSIWAEIQANYVWEGGRKITGLIAGEFQIGELVTGSVSGATGRLASAGNVSGAGFIVLTRVTGTFKTSAPWDSCVGGTSGATITQDAAPTNNYGILVYASGETTTKVRLESLTRLIVDVDEDDPDGSMADSPKLEVEVGTSNRDVIRRILLRTKCGMRYENDGKMHALYLDSTDAAQYEFQSTHAFFIDLRDKAIIIPNTVYFVDKLPDAIGAATAIGTANDATSVSVIGTIVAPMQVDPDITADSPPDPTSTDGNTRAAAWIHQMLTQAYQGRIVAPMECGLEIYDMVQCVDARLGVTTKGRVGRIERRYAPADGVYEVNITLGNVYSEPSGMDMGPGNTGVDLLPMSPPEMPDQLNVWQIPAAVQGYQHDITFTATDNDTVSWTATNGITFYDGTVQAIVNGNTGNLTDTYARYIYFDLDTSPTILKVATVVDYIAGLTTKKGVVCLVQKSSASGINATVIPSYGKEPLITADVIHMAGLLVPDLGSGRKLQSILATQISAGNLKLTSATVKDGTWYSESGVSISASTGINIWGTNNALTTRATEDGTIQCSVNAAGQITAGANKVIMDGDGLTIKGQLLILQHTDASISGYVYGNSTELLILSGNSRNITLSSADSIRLEPTNDVDIAFASFSKGIFPTTNDYGYIGTTNFRFYTCLFRFCDGNGFAVVGTGGAIDFGAAEYIDIPRRASAPTGVSGRKYYDTSLSKFRKYITGWTDDA